MNFLSIVYGLFLLIVLVIYWSLKQETLRLWTLLIASLIFYASLEVQYIPLILLLTFINFRLAKALDVDYYRPKLLGIGIILNVLVLVSFKYLLPVSKFLQLPTFALVAPLGISFFTFECIAYLIDVYRGADATNNFLKFTTYKLFFAKLISGPITRYHNLENQFSSQLPNIITISQGLWLIGCGAFKKGLLADNLGIYVDLCFSNLPRAGSSDIWLATFAYGLQLYLDFSGYVDIVRGTALLFNLVLPENFDFPYFSVSIADFWRRWHITLGDWVRDYLYIPLGGSRQGLGRTCLNLMIVMLVTGIWHGAALGFVVWGLLHGLALVVHRFNHILSNHFELLEFWQSPVGVILAWLLTQLIVFTAWIWFRLPNLQDSTLAVQHLWGYAADEQFTQKVYVEALNLTQSQLAWVLASISMFMALVYGLNRLKLEINWYVKLFLVPLCLYSVWLFAPKGALPYIYFDF